jgi:omega-hydroxy-beta-dihydromenaquinone-9 sulfotransferase
VSAGGGRLVFVCGPSRSGTTMLARALGQRSDVHMFHELHFFEQLWSPRTGDAPLAREDAVHLAATLLGRQRAAGMLHRVALEPFEADASTVVDGLPAPVTARDVFRALLLFEARRDGKRVACESTPRTVFYLDEALELDPTARVVVMVRDPRDVVASQKHKWRARGLGDTVGFPRREVLRLRVNYHPAIVAALWRAAVEAAARHAGDPRVLVLRLEDVAADPEGSFRGLCRFLDLPFEPAMLQVPQVKSSFDRPFQHVGVNPAVVGRWRRGALRAHEIAICEALTRAGRERHGYPPAAGGAGAARCAASLAALPVKLGLIAALNARRYRRVGEAVARRLRSA